MRNALIAVLVFLFPAPAAFAEPGRVKTSDKPAVAGPQLPLKGAGATNSCAAYGVGFVKVAGSETCVKVGGAIRGEVGVRR